ncbi:DUF3095 domain-containing protein [Pseudodonghicola xiamenensis]|uniref:Adenylate cyclase n=1 Tax=Pseudodonghicola xiamenensis TaxID=337702 RepID=A0A8J3HAL3_9RHOB|nr:DUF3095 domain-containing protein [Pseudodonghicola xiamenensis]GHH00798.1 hypothetical protein GCM10010961_37770 [Pseudodonghicola xiamenensis]
MVQDQNGFYGQIVPRTDFAALLADDSFTPLPDDWVVGAADIVSSTAEIAAGRYKTVNMIGAAVIAAVANGLGGEAFPFVFEGDGALFAVPSRAEETVRAQLAALRRWADAEFGITLRAALIPIGDIRAAGLDLQVARFAPSGGADYAMFSGGGLAWAEARMKAGEYSVPQAAEGVAPDLTGLSCRWDNLKSRNGLILSLVVRPVTGADPAGFRAVAAQVVDLASGLSRGGHPVPPQGPAPHWAPGTLDFEARARRDGRPLWRHRLRLLLSHLAISGLMRTGARVGRFDPARYRAAISLNADFRKFDDGLKMTLDCDPATRDRIEAVLSIGAEAGLIRYGMVEQEEALITCFVPSALRDDHVHFVDGAAGGYASAARRLDSKLSDRT